MADQSITRALAVQNALLRLVSGQADATSLAAELTASYGAAVGAVITAVASDVPAIPPSLVAQTGKTPAVSLLTTGPSTFDLPVIAGKRGVVAFGGFALTARTGTATGGPLVFKIGTNAAHDNMVAPTNVPAAAVNATTFALPFFLPLSIAATTGGMPDMGTAPVLEITTAFTGASVLQGRFGMQVLFV